MIIEQLYTDCLAEAAYLVVSNGEAAVIDPLREPEPYMQLAEKHGATIKYIFETHFHADFVSGHLDLARKTGAEIVYGPTARPAFDAHVAADAELFRMGDIQFKLLHTPGHTLESSTYLLIDEKGNDHAIFTGDTLFLGDVGRPDLAVKSDLSQFELAGLLYDSLRKKIWPLNDKVLVYPGHGQGSACGKMMSSEKVDTLGGQKDTNYALQPELSKEAFVKLVTDDLIAPPQYFPKNALMNKLGYSSLDVVLKRGLVALEPDHFEQLASRDGVIIIDTRSADEFAEGHLPGAMFLGIDGSFAPWAGALVADLETPILFVAEEGREEEVVTRLARVGYDNTMGFLQGGIKAWRKSGKPIFKIPQLSPKDFSYLPDREVHMLDVRKESEYDSQHVIGARSFPLDFIYENLSQLEKDRTYHLYCQGGYRSMIATSILLANGFEQVINLQKGFVGLKETNLVLSAYKEPVTML